jgi:hypothetical protein
MVIKTTLIHTGWSYGKGDDQYDNGSVGSNKEVFILEKVKNSKRKKEKGQDTKIIGSRYGKHTDDQGWTTIEANKSRKPKTKDKQSTVIDSIISSIDIELKLVKNGAPGARVESPTRVNRCTVPDGIQRIKEIEFNPTTNRKQKLK